MWRQFAVVLIVTAFIVFTPGYLGARFLGGKRAFSLAVAGPMSVMFYVISGIVEYALGLRGLMPLLALVACMLILFGVIRLGIQKTLHKSFEIPISISLFGVVLVIILGALAASYVFYRGLGNPDNFLQFDDNYTHIAFINHSVQTGIFSTLKASVFDEIPFITSQPFKGSWYYPMGFHIFASIGTLVTRCSIPMAENATNVVWTGLVYPLGLYVLAQKIFGKNIQAAVIAPFAAFANIAFPIRMLTVHGPFPNILSFCCVPVAVFLFIEISDAFLQKTAGRHSQNKSIIPQSLVLGFILLGIIFCHPNGVFFWAILIFPYILLVCIPKVVNSKFESSSHRVAILISAEIVFTVVCIALWTLIFRSSFMASIVQFVWGWDLNPVDSIIAISNQSFILGIPELACAVFFWIGLIHAAINKKSRWYVCSFIFVSCFYVLGLMGNVAIKRFLIGFWYTDPERIAAIICIASTPLVLQGGADIVSGIQLIFQRLRHAFVNRRENAVSSHKHLGCQHKHLCMLVSMILSIPIIWALWLPVDPLLLVEQEPSGFQKGLCWMSESYIQTSWKTYSDSERAFVERVKTIVGNSVVINNPFDGSSLSYVIDGLNVYYKFKLSIGETTDSKLIRTDLNRVYYDKDVQEALKQVGAQYFMRLNLYPDDIYPTMPREDYMWSGLHVDDGAPGFEVVLQEGPYRLYRITALDE